MPEAEPATGVSEGAGSVAGAIVGHDALDGDTEAFVVGDGGLEEGDGASLSLVRPDLAEGDARGIVDADMDELPPCPTIAPLLAALAPDAVAGGAEATELLDVDVDELAGVLALVAAGRTARASEVRSLKTQPVLAVK